MEIPLGGGIVTIVDDSDYEWLAQFTWRAQKARRVFYAARAEVYVRPDGKRGARTRQMQQDILYPGVPCPKGMKADHNNRNPLDNRRSNLRLVTNRVNTLNEGLRLNNTSGYRGVYFDVIHGSFSTSLTAFGVRHNRGGFSSAEEAARAYNSLARFHHGVEAPRNVIPGGGPQYLDEAIAAVQRGRKRGRVPSDIRQPKLFGLELPNGGLLNEDG